MFKEFFSKLFKSKNTKDISNAKKSIKIPDSIKNKNKTFSTTKKTKSFVSFFYFVLAWHALGFILLKTVEKKAGTEGNIFKS
jgi:hypothetical protein